MHQLESLLLNPVKTFSFTIFQQCMSTKEVMQRCGGPLFTHCPTNLRMHSMEQGRISSGVSLKDVGRGLWNQVLNICKQVFSPEALNVQFTKGLLGWFLEVMILKVALQTLVSGDAPLLDMVAYGGYAFAGVTLAMLAKILSNYSYQFVIALESLCMGMFLVKP
ncbi:hypothetical protein IFM89_026448 [Coptis chinensis]|uniref:Uncharacterized protein n=1 Tax=Coptis chinensis TaxID=261450 RepID=A0A835IFT8_9MAGN|nr:hypothetical protein IFM89_026448 [Coptis chinensis]